MFRAHLSSSLLVPVGNLRFLFCSAFLRQGLTMAVLAGLRLVAIFPWNLLVSEAAGMHAMPTWKPLASDQ